jgi:hypothetical protein
LAKQNTNAGASFGGKKNPFKHYTVFFKKKQIFFLTEVAI